MTDSDRLVFYDRMFKATAFDYSDELWWRERDGDRSVLDFYVTCNDVFWWGCADLEQVTPDNVHVLEEAIRDCAAVDDHSWGLTLFCARVRAMRPQGAMLKGIKPEVLALFDAAGPKREIDLGNPHAHPSDGGAYEYSSHMGDVTS